LVNNEEYKNYQF